MKRSRCTRYRTQRLLWIGHARKRNRFVCVTVDTLRWIGNCFTSFASTSIVCAGLEIALVPLRHSRRIGDGFTVFASNSIDCTGLEMALLPLRHNRYRRWIAFFTCSASERCVGEAHGLMAGNRVHARAPTAITIYKTRAKRNSWGAAPVRRRFGFRRSPVPRASIKASVVLFSPLERLESKH